jgi:hypothetical protein
MRISIGMVVADLVTVLAVPAAHAQMGGGGMDGGDQTRQMMGPRMMHQETMREMHKMMYQMQEMMGDLTLTGTGEAFAGLTDGSPDLGVRVGFIRWF